MEYLGEVFWIVILLLFLIPPIQRRLLSAARMKMIRKIEKDRDSRVIALIHREEKLKLLGIPLFRFIDIHDSEDVLRAIRLTDDEVPIDLILHTPGGLAIASLQIARALKKHPARTRVIIPHYAMSGGSLLALAADEIIMDPNAVLGPVDPQIQGMPGASIVGLLRRKSINRVGDKMIVYADLAEKAQAQLVARLMELLEGKMDEERARELAERLTSGVWTHDYPITVEEAQEMGLPVSTDVPIELYKLMQLYPQPIRHSQSVHYIPVPYRGEEEE